MKFDFCVQAVHGRCKFGSKCRHKHLDICNSFFNYKQCTKSNCNKYHFYSQNAIDYTKQKFTRLCADYQQNKCHNQSCQYKHNIACSHFLNNGFCNNPKCTLTHAPLDKDIERTCRYFNEFGECNKYRCPEGMHTRIHPYEEVKEFPYERICPCDSRKCRKKVHQPQCRNYKTNKYCNTKNCKYIHCEFITNTPSNIWGATNYGYLYQEAQPKFPTYIPSSPTPHHEPYIPSSHPTSPNYQPTEPLDEDGDIPKTPPFIPSPIIHPPTPPTFPKSPSSPQSNKRTHAQISTDESEYEAIQFLTNFAQTHSNTL